MSLEKYKVNNIAKDEQAEMVNYYNDNYEKIGTVSREEAIARNLLLEAVQIWIINPHTKQVLMQKRSKKKENDSNMIDVSASGHVKENETPLQAILRETSEEVGVKPEELISTIKEINTFEQDFSKLGRKGRYFIHEYVAYLEHPLSYYKRQEDEVEELFFMSYEEVKQKIKNKDKNIRIPFNKETNELLCKIDENLYNLDKRRKGELQCEEK